MKLTVVKPNTLILNLTLDKEDPDYKFYSQARYEFDCDRWSLRIVSDAGNYFYKWTPEADRTFFEMLATASSEYLLRKLCTEVFGLATSIQKTCSNLESVFTEAQEPKIYKAIRDLDDCTDESVFYHGASYVLTTSDFYRDQENRLAIAGDADCFICLDKVFRSIDQAIIRGFDQYIRPKLK